MRTKAARVRARKARYAITFGLEADAVRQGPCVAFDRLNERPRVCGCKPRAVTIEDSLVLRWDPAHIVSVGAGGGRFDLISLCSAHHRQQHNRGIDSFAALYGLDLRALADAQALAHEPPLGVRGLAARWAMEQAPGCPCWASGPGLPREEHSPRCLLSGNGLQVLEGYDKAALFGWVRRRMAAVSDAAVGAPNLARDNLVTDMLYTLGGEFEEGSHGEDGPTWALCELAGWPS